MRPDIVTDWFSKNNNIKNAILLNTAVTIRPDIWLPLRSVSYKPVTQRNIKRTIRKGLHINECIWKLQRYGTYFWKADTKEEIATKLKEFQELVLTTDEDVIKKAFATLLYELIPDKQISIIMIMLHILSTGLAEPHIRFVQRLMSVMNISVLDVADKYLDKFYQGLSPSEVIHTIHDVWKLHPEIQLVLQMTYYDRLLAKKEYKKVKYLVSTEMEFFTAYLRENLNYLRCMLHGKTTMCTTITAVVFYVLHCSLFSNQTKNTEETIEDIVFCFNSFDSHYKSYFSEGFCQYLMLLDKDELPLTKQLIHELLNAVGLNIIYLPVFRKYQIQFTLNLEYLEYVSTVISDLDCKEVNQLKKIVHNLCQIKLNPAIEDLCIEAINNYVCIKLNEHNKIAKFVLDINKDIQECSLLTKLTLKIGEYLDFDKNVMKDKKKVVYKCFCKVRHAVNNGDLKDINIDKYREHFTFIRSTEKEEEMEKLVKFSEFLIIVMLLLMGSAYGGHHKSAEMKKYLSLKYEYDKAILYLLWCSGDVEINPGPTLKKLKSVPASQKLREWIWDMCSISLKILKGTPVNSKPKDLWKDKPPNWPCDQPFYDPRNKSKAHNGVVKSDVSLLKCILDLCNRKDLDISDYQREITAWRVEDKKLLFELHTCRTEIQTINTAIQCLINVKDTAELHQILGHIKILIDFSVHNVNNGKQKGTTDIIRGVAVIFCKICLGIHPMEKSDGIWTTEPPRWKKERKFYDPNNAGKRMEKGQDENLVNDLVEYIETHKINIPPEYTALVTACKQQNMQELFKLYTLHTNVAIIENALKYLQLEGLLDKPDVLDKLKHHGLTISTEWFNECCASPGISDLTRTSTSLRSTYINQSNAQHDSANLNLKDQNGRQIGPTDNSIHAPSRKKRSNKTSGIQEAEGKCQNKCENQYTPQPNDYHSLPPIPGIDSLLQELDQNYSSVKSQQEQLVDNHTISVSTRGQSDDIVAQKNQTTVFSSGGQSVDKVAQGNQTISAQHDAIVSQDKENASISTYNHRDMELSENPENDELLNKVLSNYTGGSVKWDNVDDPLIKDMDPLVSWINDNNDNNS